jgi:phospholipid-binding lipoprotein MlaA
MKKNKTRLRLFPVIDVPIKSMDFFVWLGLSRGFEQHAASLRNGLRMQAQTRPARARRRHSELWQRRATTPDVERRDSIGMFITGNSLSLVNLRYAFCSLSFIFAFVALSGCATPGKGDTRDPLEGYNRAVYKLNDAVDRAVLKPVAKGYDKATPDLVKTGVRNFFSNLGDVVVFTNDLLQGKGEQALSDFGRLFINSTFGLAGLFDIASSAGLHKNNEDFGQTLGKWGVGPGPYFVLPLLGPSTIRDAAAKPIDAQLNYSVWIDHVPTRNSLYVLEVIDTRASLLGASNVLGEAALDPYIFVRDAYLQRRQRLVFDGNPPMEEDDFDEEEEDSKTPAAESGEKSGGQK